MSRKSGRLATSLLNQRMLLYYFISLIFYTVSLTKAANISKQKYYHDAYQIFFGITPSLLFRRVSRLSYAGSPPAGLETVAEVFQEVAAVKERVIAPSASLTYCTRAYQFDRWVFHMWWSHGMNKFTASIPDAEANEWHFCFSQRLCQISISPMICCANTPYRSSNSMAYTYRGTESCRKGILCCEMSGPPSFNSTPLPSWIYRELPEPVALAQTLKPLDVDDFHDDK